MIKRFGDWLKPFGFIDWTRVGLSLGVPVIAAAMIAVKLNETKPLVVKGGSVGFASVKAAKTEAERVLVVMNDDSPDSVRIAAAYIKARAVPAANLVRIKTKTSEEIKTAEYLESIQKPIQNALKKSKNPIDFIVLTRGIPIRLDDIGGYSVDATLAAMEINVAPIKQKVGSLGIDDPNPERCVNPYFRSNEPFSHAKFGLYLVTRLTGYDADDAVKLITKSLNAKKYKGPFLLDSQPLKPRDGGYGEMEKTLSQAADKLTEAGLDVEYDVSPEFVQGSGPLMGYASWGSNDNRFSLNTYRKLRFKAGAISETFVSTSGRTFERTSGGQSLIADLISQGITGVKGYVSEPYTFALCRTQILFDRYTKGACLAEAFYAASPVMKWKDIVIGDPLCRPFKADAPFAKFNASRKKKRVAVGN